MSLEQRLTDDMKAAMKAGEKDTLGVIRRVLAAIKNARIEKKADLDEQDEIKVVRSIAKQHKESIEQFRAAGREDLATKEEAELEILSVYLPPEMDEAQLDAIVDEVIAVNDKVSDAPELVNSDPYGDGWLIKVRLSDPGELDALMDAAGYTGYVQGLSA